MKALLDDYKWSINHKGTFTLEETIEKLSIDRDNHHNSCFQIENKGIIITTCDKGNVFYVTKYKDDNPSFSTMIDTYRESYDIAALGELINNYSDDKLGNFEEAKDYNIKMLIDNMTDNEKDNVLFALIKEKSK